MQKLRDNVEAALDSVQLDDIRKFCTRSRRICNGYTKGLDGQLSVWAAKRYRGHREYPAKILEEVEHKMKKKDVSTNDVN
ncbi:hypothetical protein BDV93DRAFT_564663 [Ceratobasidium sp. AG-I]|nr:hypothetical protein BDV93DRAFT_564663 [Ceratobasidium sp. AG-I]